MKNSTHSPLLPEDLDLETSLGLVGMERTPKTKKAKTRRLSRASHELRTPLTNIIGAAAILEDTELDADQRELLTIVQQGAETLQRLVENALLRCQLRSGPVQMNIGPEDLTQTLALVVTSLSGEARDRSVTLIFQPIDLPPYALIDGSLLSQLTASLILRAMTLITSGTIHLTARWSFDRLTCEVIGEAIDGQTGVRTACRETRQDPFDSSDLDQPFCADLAFAMGGVVRNAAGKGAHSLSFRVPAPIPKIQPTRPAATDVMRRLKVLIAEDNPSIQILMSRIVSAANCDLVVVSDGLEAVTAATREHFDLCFMDLRMPNLGGEAALARLRKLPQAKGLSVVAVTAEISPTAQNAGFDGFLNKPLQPALILQAIEDRRRAAA